MRCKGLPPLLNLSVAIVGLITVLASCAWGAPKETVLYTFMLGADGGAPAAGLIRDAAGNLYGTTFATSTGGNGTVFELSPAVGGGWTHSVLYSFGPSPDGASPWAG